MFSHELKKMTCRNDDILLHFVQLFQLKIEEFCEAVA
jgi:hypothetical protein